MKLSFAPIHGKTLAHYRNLHAQIYGGIDTYYAPFIVTTDPSQASAPLFEDVLPGNNAPGVQVVPQLLSNNGDDFTHYALKIYHMGYREINWNIGCPFPTVTRKKRGAGLLQHPRMIRRFLNAVCQNKPYDLTVKMRLGYDTLDDGLEVMDVLNDFPISRVIIHGRTSIQKYEGQVDLDAFAELAHACKHEVAYNGDIYTSEDFQRIHQRFSHIDEFMIGRGALRNPMLPALIRGLQPSAQETVDKLKQFHDGLLAHFAPISRNENAHCAKMKDFWTYAHEHVDPESVFLPHIRKASTLVDYQATVEQMLDAYLQRNK